MMTDALEWTQMQHAGAIENYILQGDHRRVKRSPVIGPLNPVNFPVGVVSTYLGLINLALG